VILVPIGEFPAGLLERLSRRAEIPIGPARVDPSVAWNAARGQYDSTRLVNELKARYDQPVIGATCHDLFIPVMTFVFGAAEMSGRAAVFSIHRLRDEFYGLPPNEAMLELRAYRELCHEAGHLRGLPHCPDWSCIMSSAHSVERVDSKEDRYCEECAARLAAAK
jgi:archaemetzincin